MIIQSLQKLSQFICQSLTTKIFSYHDPLGIYQIHSRNKFHFIYISNTFSIQKIRPLKLFFFQRFCPFRLFFVNRDTYNLETPVCILRIEFFKLGISLRQGLHHDAQKSIRTYFLPWHKSVKVTDFPSCDLAVKTGTLEPI